MGVVYLLPQKILSKDRIKMSEITAIVLTFNEEIHLERCLQSIGLLTNKIVVVDSFSTDSTVEICKKFNVTLLQKTWENNHAKQFNWALTQLSADTQWVLRVDADEVLTDELVEEIKSRLPGIKGSVNGVNFIRKITFQQKLIRFGGVGSNVVTRLFRYGYGQSHSHWMDEHVGIKGDVISFRGSMIDDNLNTLTWWTTKHNNYACREALELLIIRYPELRGEDHFAAKDNGHLRPKRWIKEVIYSRLPSGVRSFMYFLYRYIVLFGFLDGAKGFQFHFLQGFWYRYLVDAKVVEVLDCVQRDGVSVKEAVRRVLGIAL